MGTFCEDVCVFMVVSHQVLLSMRNVTDKICIVNQNTHFMCNNFFSENCAFYEIM